MEMKRGNFQVAVDTITNILALDTPSGRWKLLLHHPAITSLLYLHLKQKVSHPFCISSLQTEKTYETYTEIPYTSHPLSTSNHIPPSIPYSLPLTDKTHLKLLPTVYPPPPPPPPVQQLARQSDSQLNPYALQLFNMIASQLVTQQPVFPNHRHQQPSLLPRKLFQPC